MKHLKFNTMVLGAGLTGLALSTNLKEKHIVIEKNGRAGGLCGSIKKDGFTFDYTGHLIHLKKDISKKIVFNALGKNIEEIERKAWIYSENVFTKYPYQLNLFGLPKKIIDNCILGLKLARSPKNRTVDGKKTSSFYDWSLRTFGSGITTHFMKSYNEKLWGISARKLTSDWVDKFVPIPDLKDVIRGVDGDNDRKIGYNATFYYPKTGGIQSLIEGLLKKIKSIKYNSSPLQIDLKNKKLRLSTGEVVHYERIISTIPLPELLSLVSLEKNRAKLACRSVLCLNIGVDGAAGHDKHWIYFPEKEFIFYRVGFYSNINKESAPPDKHSMYVEISVKNRSGALHALINAAVEDLLHAGLLKDRRKISTLNVLPIKYAYVIYDKNRSALVQQYEEELQKNDIYLAGRYGAWKYSYMEESILEAVALAEKINRGVI